ncbi:hypothetical protein J7413_18975 [Shimia sp. R10_1]|uniref:hypothetical protein n=1 Tax=Shimia sp. R10_1 TaxID=2821095 RepID=UPI001AD9773D|nr:hypothetical protein [Shimia sp. R10_1]MBO9475632.1 hypothetical protein [Shimia sp. R10_1]
MKFGFAGLLIGMTLATQAVAEEKATPIVIQQIQQCISDTRAPGKYKVTAYENVPVVVSDAGGTDIGASNVNDCLQDTYGVQYETNAFASVSDKTSFELAEQQCRNTMVGGAILGVVAGAAVWHWAGYSAAEGAAIAILGTPISLSGFMDRCLRDKGFSKSQGLEFASGCSRKSDVLHGGSQYCRR